MRKFLFFSCFIFPYLLFAKFSDISIDCKAAILVNAENGNILYEKNAHTPCFPASLTKMATALFVIENTATLEHKIAVSKEAILSRDKRSLEDPPYFLEKAGSTIGLKIGESLSLKSLLYGLLVASGNDAANVIAEALGGSVPLFMEDLNYYLYSLGCKSTHFLNPHGLHHPEHKTTAYDLSLIARRAMKDPFFRKIVSSERYFLPKTNKQDEKRLLQTNALVCKDSLEFYPYAFGIKTGYTSEARHSIAVAAEYKGRFLIAIILGAKSSKDRYKDARKLFETAFSEERKNRIVVKKSKKFFHDCDGKNTLVTASLKDDVQINYYPSEKTPIKAFTHWEDLTLPIKKGQKVGEIRVTDEKDRILQTESLYADQGVSSSFISSLKKLFR